jgi:glucokinase
MRQQAIGVDIGGTKISAGVIENGRLEPDTLLTERTPAAAGPREIVPLVVRLVRELESGVGVDVAGPVGVGAAGVINAQGVVLSSTSAIANWRGYDLRGSLSDALARPVAVLNDVHAAAVGEAQADPGDGSSTFLMVTVGTGVGGALCRGSVPDFGATGTAGSIGHTAARNQEPRMCPCGQIGHIEAFASGPAMEAAYFMACGKHLGLREIVALASGEPGDAEAARVLREGAEVLGVGLADAMNLIDVDKIVIGGGVASLGQVYLDLVRGAFAVAALPGPSRAKIRGARLGTQATLVGAGLYASSQSSEINGRRMDKHT